MLDQILNKVNTLTFDSKSFTQDSNSKVTFQLKDILYIKTFKKGYVYFFTARWGSTSKYKIKGTLFHFEKLLLNQAPHFTKCHKSYLVNTHKVKSIDKANNGSFLIKLEGLLNLNDRIPLTHYFASNFSKIYHLNHLNHLEPFNKNAEKLRSFGLKSFGEKEAKKLNLTNLKVKERFRKKYGIHYFNRYRLLTEFHEKTNPDQIDKARVIRNIIYQTFQWIKWGIINKFDGSMRRLWYKYIAPTIKKLYPNKKDYTAEENALYDYFNDFVKLGIFTYEEFGFLDRYEFYRGIGEENPHIMVFMEKTTIFGFPRRLAEEFSTSFLVTSGQVPWLTAEYMSKELKTSISDLKTPLKFLTLTDLNPGGFSISNNLKKRFQFHGFNDIQIIQVITSNLYSDDLIEKNRVPLLSWKETKKGEKTIRTTFNLRDKRLFQNYYNWFFGDNENWQGINDSRLIEKKKYKNYEKVTIYGMELDALELFDIENSFNHLIAKHLKSNKDPLNKAIKEIKTILNNNLSNNHQKIQSIQSLINTQKDII